jgi:DNA-binding XRE family transcriptional regulator
MAFIDTDMSRRLRMRRAELRQTQREAAMQVGIHPQTWSAWERGILTPDTTRRPRLGLWLGDEQASHTDH